MKPIKLLLSLCAMLMGIIGVQAQTVTLAAPSGPTGSAPYCVGQTIAISPIVAGSAIGTGPGGAALLAGCANVDVFLDLMSPSSLTPLASQKIAKMGGPNNPSFELGVPAPSSMLIPASAAGLSNLYFRFSSTTAGCAFTSGNSPAPGFSVPALVQAPLTSALNSPGARDNGTAAIKFCETPATSVTITPTANCGGGTVEIYTNQSDANAGTSTVTLSLASAVTTTYYIGCQVTGGCQTLGADRVAVTATVDPRPAAPAAATLTTQANCVGSMPTITQTNACAAGTELVFYKNATDLLTTTDVAAPGSWNLAPACRNLTTGCVTLYSATPWVTGGGDGSGTGGTTTSLYTVVNPPAFTVAPTINGTGAVQSNTNTTATICRKDVTGNLTFTGTCPAGVPGVLSARIRLYSDAALTTEVVPSAGISFGGAPFTTIAAPTATTTYYAVCQLDACKGPVTTLTWVVKPTPDAPTVSALPTVCAGTTVTIVAATYATCTTGTPMVNSTNSISGGTASTSIVVAASTVTGTYNAYFTCMLDGCVSATTTTGTGTATGQPTASGGTSALSKTAICASEAGSPIAILAHGCATSDVPFVSSSTTGSPVLATASGTFAAPAATTTYYIFCKNLTTGCNSVASAGLTVLVNPNPIDPISTPVLSRTSAPCPTDLGGPLTITATCTNAATEQVVVFTSNSATATPIVTLSSGPTAALFAVPSTTTSYWVACRNTTTLCVGVNKIAAGTFTVNAALPDPTLVSISATGATGNGTTALSICASSASSLLPITAAGTCLTGSVRLYDNNTTANGGLNPRSIDLFSTPGVYTYYVGCVAGSCESPAASRVPVTFTINARPTAPAGPTLSANACIGVVPTIVTSTCSAGSTSTLMTTATGSTQVSAADVMTSGSKTFYLECTTASGCTLFTRPSVSYTVTAATAPVGTLTKTALCVSDAGTPIGIATHDCPTSDVPFVSSSNTGSPVLATASGTFAAPAATTTYYLFCRNVSTNCISNPSPQVVTVNVNPIDPISTPVLSRTSAPCPTDLGADLTITATCSNAATERLVVFTSDSPTANPIVTVTSGASFATFVAPGTTTSYWVACRNTTTLCTGVNKIAAGTFTVNAALPDPTLVSISATGATGNGTTALSICASSASSLLPITAAGTCVTGSVRLYDNKTTALGGLNPRSIDLFNTPGVYTYYVGCVSGSCESPAASRVPVTFTINARPTAPAAPTLSANACIGVVPTIVTTTCSAGSTSTLMTTATGSTQVSAADVMTSGAKTFYLECTTASGCTLFTRPSVSYTVTATTAPVGTLTKTAVCASDAGTPIGIATHDCPTSDVPFVSSSNTGSPVLATASGTFAAPAATTTYYLFCRNVSTNCISNPQSQLVTVNANPIDPISTPVLDRTSAPCPTDLGGPLTITATCSNTATERLVVFTSNSATATPIVTITSSASSATFAVPSATTTYWVACRNVATLCVGVNKIAAGTFTVNAALPDPTLVSISATGATGNGTTALSICGTLTSSLLPMTAAGTCVTGSVRLYDNNTTALGGLNPRSIDLGNAPGVYTYYVGCVAGSCESPAASRVPVTFTINRTPVAPTLSMTPSGPVCQGTELTFTTSCGATTDVAEVWGSKDGGAFALVVSGVNVTTLKTTPATGGSYTYRARCVSVLGCPSANSATTTAITINPVIAPPTIAPNATTALVPSSICVGTTTVLNNNLTCTPTQVLVWYLSNSASAPAIATPNLTPATTTTYYVACKETNTALECETVPANRYAVTFTVNPLGSTPTSVSLTADGVTVNAGETKSTCNIDGNGITFTGCPSSETTLYSVDGGNYSATLPTQMVDGLPHNYRIRCQAGSASSACVGPESAAMTLTINVQPTVAPNANLSPQVICSAAPAVPFGGSSNCAPLATVWFDATTNAELASLPPSTFGFAPGTYSYYAKCKSAGGCLSPASAITTLTVINNTAAPVVTVVGGTEVCTGVNVTLTTNCPSGSSVVWSTGATGNALALVSNVPQVRAVTAKCVTTVGNTTCESPVSATTSVIWKAFDLTVINIGSSQSGVKPGAGVPKSAWAANFVTVDAGPSLQSSSQSNPTVFFTENPNKMGPRFWTIHVEACNLPTTGAISYDMLATPETGVPMSFNTVENNAPYLMYANRDGFTELYAQNNPFFGFWSDNGSGGNKYDAGLPKGLYKLSVRYWDQKGLGAAPATRIPQGTQLAYQEYWFRIQSQNGIGTGAAREGVGETTETEFAIATPNPVTRTLTVSINGAKGQEVKLNLVDAAGRTIKTSTVTPETNTHREEVDMTSQNTGMYFMQVSSPTKRASLKVLKVSQD